MTVILKALNSNDYRPHHAGTSTSTICISYVADFQANTFDETSDQQGYFTFLHKWLILTEARHLPSIENYVQNISNVAVVSWEKKVVEMVRGVLSIYP